MNKELDIKIENKKKLLDESISEYNLKNNEIDNGLISRYKKELNELLEIKSFDFEIDTKTLEVTSFKSFVMFNGKEFESTPLISLLNKLINTSLSGNKISIDIKDLPEMLKKFDVVKLTTQGVYYKSNSFGIFYKKIFKAVYGKKWEDFSNL